MWFIPTTTLLWIIDWMENLIGLMVFGMEG